MRRLPTNMIKVLMLLLVCMCLLPTATLTAAPVVVETKELSSPVADPFVTFVSRGPKHEFEPVYRVLETGACSVLAHRVLILRYANYESIVVEELGFAGNNCQDVKIRKSLSISGVTLGYALGEGTRFAWNIQFLGWETFNTFMIRSAQKDFRIHIDRDGKVFAEQAKAVSISE